jgi:hypothetical protein
VIPFRYLAGFQPLAAFSSETDVTVYGVTMQNTTTNVFSKGTTSGKSTFVDITSRFMTFTISFAIKNRTTVD